MSMATTLSRCTAAAAPFVDSDNNVRGSAHAGF
jgi:hypothetical protein